MRHISLRNTSGAELIADRRLVRQRVQTATETSAGNAGHRQITDPVSGVFHRIPPKLRGKRWLEGGAVVLDRSFLRSLVFENVRVRGFT